MAIPTSSVGKTQVYTDLFHNCSYLAEKPIPRKGFEGYPLTEWVSIEGLMVVSTIHSLDGSNCSVSD